MSAIKLLLSLVIYTILVTLFEMSSEFIIMGGCILFAGFIAAKDE